MPTRVQRAHPEEWRQLTQLCLWPEQPTDELLRPLVLYGGLPADRARETGVAERRVREQADQFDTEGGISLFHPPQAPARPPSLSAPTHAPGHYKPEGGKTSPSGPSKFLATEPLTVRPSDEWVYQPTEEDRHNRS